LISPHVRLCGSLTGFTISASVLWLRGSASLKASMSTVPAVAAILKPRRGFHDTGPPRLLRCAAASALLSTTGAPFCPPHRPSLLTCCTAAGSTMLGHFAPSIPSAAAALPHRRCLHCPKPFQLLPSISAAAAALLHLRCCPPHRQPLLLPCYTAAGSTVPAAAAALLSRPALLLLRTGASAVSIMLVVPAPCTVRVAPALVLLFVPLFALHPNPIVNSCWLELLVVGRATSPGIGPLPARPPSI
jgi:hypothetical protein